MDLFIHVDAIKFWWSNIHNILWGKKFICRIVLMICVLAIPKWMKMEWVTQLFKKLIKLAHKICYLLQLYKTAINDNAHIQWVYISVWAFIYSHTFCMQAAEALCCSLIDKHKNFMCRPIWCEGPWRNKTCHWGFRQSQTQTSLLSYRDQLEIFNFTCSKFRYATF